MFVIVLLPRVYTMYQRQQLCYEKATTSLNQSTPSFTCSLPCSAVPFHFHYLPHCPVLLHSPRLLCSPVLFHSHCLSCPLVPLHSPTSPSFSLCLVLQFSCTLKPLPLSPVFLSSSSLAFSNLSLVLPFSSSLPFSNLSLLFVFLLTIHRFTHSLTQE